MKIQCKKCHKIMEPKIINSPYVTLSSEKTYYCSLCGAELFETGGNLTLLSTNFSSYLLVDLGIKLFRSIKKWFNFSKKASAQNIGH